MDDKSPEKLEQIKDEIF